jgi:hypothetical protein
MENFDTLGGSALRYLPARQVGHGSGTFAGVTMCTAEGEPLGEFAGMVVEPAVRRTRFLVIERPGKLRSRRYLLDADTPAVLDPNGQTLRVEADEDDLERFDARTIPTFSDDDLIEALFAKPAA